jgi:hypothetical protein
MSTGPQRRAMLAGVLFVVFFVVGVFLNFGNTPEIKSTDTAATAAQKWLTEMSTSEHRVGVIISAYLLIIAAIAFIWFCDGLRGWLALEPTWGRAVTGLGVLGAAAIGVGALLGGAGFAGAVEFGESPLPQSGDTMRVMAELFFPMLFVLFGLASACIIGTLSTAVARTGALPRWVAYTGYVAALGAIAGVLFTPFILPLLWFLIVAVLGARRATGARGGARETQA